MKTKNMKRILEVRIIREIDTDPDTSDLGDYSNRAGSEYAIDRAHSEDCASLECNHRAIVDKLERILQPIFAWRKELGNDADNQEWESLDMAADILGALQDEAMECDCHGGCQLAREYRYFNPNYKNYDGCTKEEIRKYCRQDFDRMESYNNQQWYYLGIHAEANVQLGEPRGVTSNGGHVYTTQIIHSGGLWGTESDSDESYLKEIEQEELSTLRTELKAIGFSTRAISTAFKNVVHKED